jgi:hypothetical protein
MRVSPQGINPNIDLSPVPATFYGIVQAGPDLLPVPGMQVTAWVNGQPRGQAFTRLESDQVVYSIQVSGIELGATVAFQINGQWAPHSTAWDNTHCVRFDLLLAESTKIFLPIITTNGFTNPDVR